VPTVAVVEQGGKDVLRIVLVAAHFDSPVASDHFVIPEASPQEE